MPDPAPTITEPAATTQADAADDADVEAILNEAEALVRATLEGPTDQPPPEGTPGIAPAGASEADDAGPAPDQPEQPRPDVNEMVAAVIMEAQPGVAPPPASLEEVIAEAPESGEAVAESPSLVPSPVAPGSAAEAVPGPPAPELGHAAPEPPAPPVQPDRPPGPDAPSSIRRAVARFAVAPIALVAHILAVIDKPFASVSDETKRLLGWLAVGTAAMGGVAWLLPWAMGRTVGSD